MLLKLQIPTIVAGLEAFVIVTETRIVFQSRRYEKYSSFEKDKGDKEICAGSSIMEYKV